MEGVGNIVAKFFHGKITHVEKRVEPSPEMQLLQAFATPDDHDQDAASPADAPTNGPGTSNTAPRNSKLAKAEQHKSMSIPSDTERYISQQALFKPQAKLGRPGLSHRVGVVPAATVGERNKAPGILVVRTGEPPRDQTDQNKEDRASGPVVGPSSNTQGKQPAHHISDRTAPIPTTGPAMPVVLLQKATPIDANTYAIEFRYRSINLRKCLRRSISPTWQLEISASSVWKTYMRCRLGQQQHLLIRSLCHSPRG